MNENLKKILKILSITFVVITAFVLASYFCFIPKLVSNPKAIHSLEKIVKKTLGADLKIINPILETPFAPNFTFKTDAVSLTKDSEILLNLKNIETTVDFSKIFLRKIKLVKLGADDIYVDINKLQKLTIKEEKKEKKKQKPFFKIDCFNTLFYIKKCMIIYTSKNNVEMKLLARDLEISDERQPKKIHFGIYLDLFHNNQHLRLFFLDKDKIYFKDRKLHADNFKFYINHSPVFVNALIDEKGKSDITVESDKFEINNVNLFLNTNLIIPNGSNFVSCFKDFTGDFKFKINMTNDGINGFVKVNKIGLKLIPVANLPFNISKGVISLDNKDINIKDIEGYYANNKNNKISAYGIVKDYAKTAETQVFVSGLANDSLAKYISKMAQIDMAIQKTAPISTEILSLGNKLSIKGNMKIPVGSDLLFNGASISSPKFERIFDYDMDLIKNDFNINHIDYIIKNGSKQDTLIKMGSNFDIVTGEVKTLFFNVPTPLPSEFFNILIGQTIFRNGTFSGDMTLANQHLNGFMNLKDVIISGQATIVKDMTLKALGDNINISSTGGIRLAKYKFNANIINNMVFPIIVKDANFDVDDMDVEKVIKTFAPRTQRPKTANTQQKRVFEFAKSDISKEYFAFEQKQPAKNTNTDNNEPVAFQPNLIEIRQCMLNVDKGVYKTVKFGNLHANLTLTKEGILEVKSNKFDFTDGISTLRVYCDLLKEKYYIRLGGKSIDTDAVSSSILNLPNEISGKADALIELNTDASQKLNGKIQFEIKNGMIAKLGLVEYILKVANIFRNPIANIGPASLVDLVNVPEGEFNKISGTIEIKNNIIEKMIIKSMADQLSSLIVGRINLETMDVSLSVYTKFTDDNKGVLGFLRGLSLDALSRKASTMSKTDTATYYATQLSFIPKLEKGDDVAHVYLTKIDGDIQTSNYISQVKKIK